MLRELKIGLVIFLAALSCLGQNSPCPPWPPPKPKIISGGVFGKDSIIPDSSEKKFVKLTEQQVMFSKKAWSFIDFKEKLNKTLYNNSNPKTKIYPLYEVLNLWIVTGKIKCFKNSSFGSSQNTPVSMAEFKRMGIRRDTIEERIIDDNGEEKVVKELRADTITCEKILGFVIKEDWFFNKRSVLMEKKIIGFAPVYYDSRAHKNRELYWVYYPECCELLSSYQTINPTGLKEIYTYRDALESRNFSAYVLKESNVYNRDKPENSKGFEVETENKKNKERGESDEEDLWSK